MKVLHSIACGILFLGTTGAGATSNTADVQTKVLQSTKGKPLFVEDELLVKFHPGVPQHAVERFNRDNGTVVVADLPYGIKKLKLAAGKSPKALAASYAHNPNVVFAHPNYIAYAAMTPNDPFFSGYQWNLDNPVNGGIKMKAAWDESDAGLGAVVAVLDTGIAYENYDEDGDGVDDYIQGSDFASTFFVPGYDFINNDAHPNDDEGHGTHVAGTIAQSTNDAVGTAGIAYRAALMPVKVLGADGSGSSDALISAINYATQNGADVINMSLSFGSYSGVIPGLEVAIADAYSNGVMLVAATGNEGNPAFVSYPANNPNVVAVGATDFYENVTSYSNKGAEVEISAPGGDTSQNLSAYGYGLGGIVQQTLSYGNPLDLGYWYYEGTSMATPHVTGVAALIKGIGGTFAPGEVRTILQESSKDHGTAGRDSAYGYGIVDAHAATLLAQTYLNPNTAPTAVIDGDSGGMEDISVYLDASGSSDSDGDPLTYSWDIDGALYSGPAVNHTFGWGGDFTVTLTVDDGKGGIDTATEMLSIAEVNDLPVADAGGVYSGVTGADITFDASATTDYDNEDGSPLNDQTLNYSWDFGDGSGASGVQAVHAYAAEGNYTVTLSVSDGVDMVTQTVIATVTSQPAVTFIDQSATADIPVAGTVSGSYLDTLDEDGVAETITERESGGRPSGRYAYLEHQWTFSVQAGDQMTLFASASTAAADESFTFAYSDGGAFVPMFTVLPGIAQYSYALPANLNGTVTVRVMDNIRVSGDRTLHNIVVDRLLIQTQINGVVTTIPAAPTDLAAVADSHMQVSLSWIDNASDEQGYRIDRSIDGSSWNTIATTAANISAYADSGLLAATTYYYRVTAFNAVGDSAAAQTSVTTLDEPAAPAIELSATQYKSRADKVVLLNWVGSQNVDIFRNDVLIQTGVSGNSYENNLGKSVLPSYAYKVCESGSTAVCSNVVTVYY